MWPRDSPRHSDSDTTFKVKRSRSQAVLLSAALTRKVAAAVSVGTYSAWESILLRCVCSAAREALGRPRGEERGGDTLCRHAHSLFYLLRTQASTLGLRYRGKVQTDCKSRRVESSCV